MNKQLLLTTIEAELTIKIVEEDLLYFKDELQNYKVNKETILINTTEDLYLEDIEFFETMIRFYDDLLRKKLYKYRSQEQVFVNTEECEIICIRIETVLDDTNCYLESSSNEDEVTYINSIKNIYKSIFNKILDLQLYTIRNEKRLEVNNI